MTLSSSVSAPAPCSPSYYREDDLFPSNPSPEVTVNGLRPSLPRSKRSLPTLPFGKVFPAVGRPYETDDGNKAVRPAHDAPSTQGNASARVEEQPAAASAAEKALLRRYESDAAKHWGLLTPEQREAWSVCATTMIRRRRGTPSGSQLYRAAQAQRLAMELPMTFEAPTRPCPEAPVLVELVENPSGELDGFGPDFGQDPLDGEVGGTSCSARIVTIGPVSQSPVLRLRIVHQLPTLAGIKVRVSLSGPLATTASGRQRKPRAGEFSLAAGPVAESHPDARRSGETIVVHGVRTSVAPGECFAIRVQFVTVEGVAGAELTAVLRRPQSGAQCCGPANPSSLAKRDLAQAA